MQRLAPNILSPCESNNEWLDSAHADLPTVPPLESLRVEPPYGHSINLLFANMNHATKCATQLE